MLLQGASKHIPPPLKLPHGHKGGGVIATERENSPVNLVKRHLAN